MKIKRKKRHKTVLILDHKEVKVLSALVDVGFDDFFRDHCSGNPSLKSSRIAAKFFDELQVLAKNRKK